MLMTTFSILVGLAVAGRFYSRIVVKDWFGWDDGTMIVATVSDGGLRGLMFSC